MRDKIIRTKVTGVSFKNDDSSARQENIRKYCKTGGELNFELGRSPSGGYSFAVFVTSSGRRHQIGYLKQDLADEIVGKISGKSCIILGHITEVTGGTPDKPIRGVNVELEIANLTEDEIKKLTDSPKGAPAPKYTLPAYNLAAASVNKHSKLAWFLGIVIAGLFISILRRI